MDHKQESQIPYLFLPLTEKEEDQLATMQDFMKQQLTNLPLMTVKTMLHHMAIQLQNVLNIWKNDLVKQAEKNDENKGESVPEQQKKHITNMLLAQSIAFIVANKAYISNKDDIFKQAAMLLSLLYPPSDEEEAK